MELDHFLCLQVTNTRAKVTKTGTGVPKRKARKNMVMVIDFKSVCKTYPHALCATTCITFSVCQLVIFIFSRVKEQGMNLEMIGVSMKRYCQDLCT